MRWQKKQYWQKTLLDDFTDGTGGYEKIQNTTGVFVIAYFGK